MNRKSSKSLRLVLPISVMIILLMGGYRYVSLNKQVPNPIEKIYIQGQDVILNHVQYTVTDVKMSLINEEIPDYIESIKHKNGELLSKEDSRIILATVKIKNNGGGLPKGQRPSLQYAIRSNDYANAYALELFYDFNPSIEKITPDPGGEAEVIFPFTIYSVSFTPKVWEDIDNQPFDFVLTIYPEDNRIRLNTKKGEK